MQLNEQTALKLKQEQALSTEFQKNNALKRNEILDTLHKMEQEYVGAQQHDIFAQDAVYQDICKKIDVIKAVKKVTNWGLTEAKKAVEEAPSVIMEAMPKAEAEKLKKELEAAGATVELS